jgi:hypothetical protein
MAVIAILGLGFAFLPILLSVVLAITMVGSLVLQGMRLPPVTDRRGVWKWLPWVLWSLALAACPIAIEVIGEEYVNTGPPALGGPLPWAARVVDNLGLAHLGVSVVASVSVVVLMGLSKNNLNDFVAFGARLAPLLSYEQGQYHGSSANEVSTASAADDRATAASMGRV